MTCLYAIIGCVAIFGASLVLCGKAPVEQCPESKVTSLTHNVNAILPGDIALPFVGVTGTEACSGVTRNGAPAPCPLEPNTEYQLRSIIPVEPFYPTIGQLTVKWGLRDQNDKNVICFTVPAAIKDAKTKKST